MIGVLHGIAQVAADIATVTNSRSGENRKLWTSQLKLIHSIPRRLHFVLRVVNSCSRFIDISNIQSLLIERTRIRCCCFAVSALGRTGASCCKPEVMCLIQIRIYKLLFAPERRDHAKKSGAKNFRLDWKLFIRGFCIWIFCELGQITWYLVLFRDCIDDFSLWGPILTWVPRAELSSCR